MASAKTIDDLRYAIEHDSETVERAILLVYKYQTESEKANQETREHNRVGFSGPDAKRFSYYANYIANGGHLTGKHLEIAHKRMGKYAGQLISLKEKGLI